MIGIIFGTPFDCLLEINSCAESARSLVVLYRMGCSYVVISPVLNRVLARSYMPPVRLGLGHYGLCAEIPRDGKKLVRLLKHSSSLPVSETVLRSQDIINRSLLPSKIQCAAAGHNSLRSQNCGDHFQTHMKTVKTRPFRIVRYGKLEAWCIFNQHAYLLNSH